MSTIHMGLLSTPKPKLKPDMTLHTAYWTKGVLDNLSVKFQEFVPCTAKLSGKNCLCTLCKEHQWQLWRVPPWNVVSHILLAPSLDDHVQDAHTFLITTKCLTFVTIMTRRAHKVFISLACSFSSWKQLFSDPKILYIFLAFSRWNVWTSLFITQNKCRGWHIQSWTKVYEMRAHRKSLCGQIN